jgi:hypothetical protein
MEQKKFIHQVEVDHLVNLVYADIVERMYRNKISLNDMLSEREFQIDEAYLRGLDYNKNLPYTGSYKFKKALDKGKDPYVLYLFELDFTFVPTGKKEAAGEALKYHYKLFVKHDLGEGGLPKGGDDDDVEGEK